MYTKPLVLLYPRSKATSVTVAPRDRRSMASTNTRRVFHCVNVMAVSLRNSRARVRAPVPVFLVHVVTLECKDEDHARRCLDALANYGKPDAHAFNCVSYEFGRKKDSPAPVYLIERWNRWEDLDALLQEKVIPALPLYNELLKRPFDPATNTLRIALSD